MLPLDSQNTWEPCPTPPWPLWPCSARMPQSLGGGTFRSLQVRSEGRSDSVLRGAEIQGRGSGLFPLSSKLRHCGVNSPAAACFPRPPGATQRSRCLQNLLSLPWSTAQTDAFCSKGKEKVLKCSPNALQPLQGATLRGPRRLHSRADIPNTGSGHEGALGHGVCTFLLHSCGKGGPARGGTLTKSAWDTHRPRLN
jgi:hypothetical protein